MFTGCRVAVVITGFVGEGANSDSVSVIVADGMVEVGVPVGVASKGKSDDVGVGDGRVSSVAVAFDETSVG